MPSDNDTLVLSFVQVTSVAGPPEDTQVRVFDSARYSIGDVIVGTPANSVNYSLYLLE